MTQEFPVPQSTIEAGLLSTALSNGENWLKLDEYGFTQEDFTAHREIYIFIKEYLVHYGSLPSQGQINSRFQWQPVAGDLNYWLSEMRRYTLARKVIDALNEGWKKITEPDDALRSIIEKLSLIRSENNIHIEAYDANALERFDKYLARQEFIHEGKGVLGLPTGHYILDDTRVGWLPGSMVGVFSRPGVGKTWWLLWQGMHTWMQGGTVLAITPEMPANMLDLRVDVLAGTRLGFPIEYNKLLQGDPSIQDNYKQILTALSQSKRWWTYDSINGNTISLADLVSLYRQHQPDIILIDGVSLLRPESRGQVWEQIRDICYGIKNLATIQNVPYLVSTQAVRSNVGRRTELPSAGRGDDFVMPSLNDIAFGDAFGQACSDVIAMVADKDFGFIRWFSLRKTRERGWAEDPPVRMGIAWDPGHGEIHDLSRLGRDQAAIGEEARRLLNIHA